VRHISRARVRRQSILPTLGVGKAIWRRRSREQCSVPANRPRPSGLVAEFTISSRRVRDERARDPGGGAREDRPRVCSALRHFTFPGCAVPPPIAPSGALLVRAILRI